MIINSYDLDGVIYMGENYIGLRPGKTDVIITGRSKDDEGDYTRQWLHERGMYNMLFLNPVKFEEKTRRSSGYHKAQTLNRLLDSGLNIRLHFEDDEIQALIIEHECPRVKVVRIKHDLVNKENEWHGPVNDRESSLAE